MNFTRHLVECHCTLKIFQNRSKPVYHKFPVFSLLNEDGNIDTKYVACNNCGAIHEVSDVCKSEIKWGSESLQGLVTSKEDILFNLKTNKKDIAIEILEKYDCDVSVWEVVEHCIENKIDYTIVLSRQEMQDNIVFNCLNITGGIVKIKKEISQRYI
jgi:hypothetical protein